MTLDEIPRIRGALALELSAVAPGARTGLAPGDTATLAALVARDLAQLEPLAASLQLVVVGAHYDAVELLRPGWPVHAQLLQLAVRIAPSIDGGGRIVAFGAHDTQLPAGLAPSPEHAGGPLRLCPFVLDGDAGVMAEVGAMFERELIERGMAGAATALAAQELFGLRIEHARYLTLHDLAAMMALQYEHAGLAPLWPILETALLAPDTGQWLDAIPEPLVHYADGEARIALFSPDAWQARYAAGETDPGRLQRQFAHFEARQRQFAAVLGAHGVPVTFVHCGAHRPDDF